MEGNNREQLLETQRKEMRLGTSCTKDFYPSKKGRKRNPVCTNASQMILQPPAANSGRISVPCVTSQKADLIRLVETDQLQCFPLHLLCFRSSPVSQKTNKQTFDSRLRLCGVVSQRHALPLDLIEAFLAEMIPANEQQHLAFPTQKHRHDVALPGCLGNSCQTTEYVKSLMLPFTLHHRCCWAALLTGRRVKKKRGGGLQ